MSFFKKITQAIFPSSSGGGNKSILVYVRCNVCKEVLAGRINLLNDLSLQDDGGYLSRKVLIGSNRCYRPIEVVLYFDANRAEINREISGGTFVTAEEYQAG